MPSRMLDIAVYSRPRRASKEMPSHLKHGRQAAGSGYVCGQARKHACRQGQTSLQTTAVPAGHVQWPWENALGELSSGAQHGGVAAGLQEGGGTGHARLLGARGGSQKSVCVRQGQRLSYAT